MAITVGDVVELTMAGMIDGQDVNNVLHYRLDPTDPQNDIDTIGYLCELLYKRWQATWKLMQVNAYTLTEVRGRVLKYIYSRPPDETHDDIWVEVVPDVMGAWSPPVADVGSLLEPPLASFVAASFRKETGYATRFWRGGFRLGGLSEMQVNGNQFEAQVALDLQARADLFVAPLQSANGTFAQYQMVLFSPAFHLKWADINVQQAAVTATKNVQKFMLNPFVSSQVSRKRRGE